MNFSGMLIRHHYGSGDGYGMLRVHAQRGIQQEGNRYMKNDIGWILG